MADIEMLIKNEYVERGKQKATVLGKPILVSIVEKIERIHLPSFFSSNIEPFDNRFFWSEPDRDLTIIGLGSVHTIKDIEVDQRYLTVEQIWTDLLQDSVMDNHICTASGPLLFGGFNFDPQKETTHLWRDFSHTHFNVPQFMITEEKGQCYLTSNIMISPGEENCEFQELPLHEYKKKIKFDHSHASWGELDVHEIGAEAWMEAVSDAASSIRQKKLEKVVLARQLGVTAKQNFQIDALLERLLKDQANTYVFAIHNGESCFVGATPERLIKRTGNELLTLSLAGSVARGATLDEDDQLGQFLTQDTKNLHEHALAVEMIKGVMTELCDVLQAPHSPILRKLKDIQHLATPIWGRVKEGVSLLKAVGCLHPTPALGGMPVEAAIQAIRDLENMDRGWYAAPIGWINRHMDGEFVAAIRSAIIHHHKAVLFAGCGIVGDSDPISEFNETSLKFKPMLNALEGSHYDA